MGVGSGGAGDGGSSGPAGGGARSMSGRINHGVAGSEELSPPSSWGVGERFSEHAAAASNGRTAPSSMALSQAQKGGGGAGRESVTPRGGMDARSAAIQATKQAQRERGEHRGGPAGYHGMEEYEMGADGPRPHEDMAQDYHSYPSKYRRTAGGAWGRRARMEVAQQQQLQQQLVRRSSSHSTAAVGVAPPSTPSGPPPHTEPLSPGHSHVASRRPGAAAAEDASSHHRQPWAANQRRPISPSHVSRADLHPGGGGRAAGAYEGREPMDWQARRREAAGRGAGGGGAAGSGPPPFHTRAISGVDGGGGRGSGAVDYRAGPLPRATASPGAGGGGGAIAAPAEDPEDGGYVEAERYGHVGRRVRFGGGAGVVAGPGHADRRGVHPVAAAAAMRDGIGTRYWEYGGRGGAGAGAGGQGRWGGEAGEYWAHEGAYQRWDPRVDPEHSGEDMRAWAVEQGVREDHVRGEQVQGATADSFSPVSLVLSWAGVSGGVEVVCVAIYGLLQADRQYNTGSEC